MLRTTAQKVALIVGMILPNAFIASAALADDITLFETQPPQYCRSGAYPGEYAIAEQAVDVWGDNSVHSRYVINNAGMLVEFQSVNGGFENRSDLTQVLNGSCDLVDLRAVFDYNSFQTNIFALSRSGEVRQYQWSPQRHWIYGHSLTQAAQGQRLQSLGRAFFYSPSNLHGVTGYALDGRAVQYIYRPNTAAWHFERLN